MTPDEALHLCRLAKALSPQMAMDEFTPEAWGMALDTESFADAQAALRNIIRRESYVDVSKIVAEVKRIRADRIREFGPFDPPLEVQEGRRDYTEWLGSMRRAIADGTLTREAYEAQRPAIEANPERVQRMIQGSFRGVNDKPEPGDPGPCTEPGCEDPWCDHGGAA